MSLKIKILELSKLALVLFTLINYILAPIELKDKALSQFLGSGMAVLIDVSKRAYDSTKESDTKEKKKKKKK